MHRNRKVLSIFLSAVFIMYTFSAALAAPAAQALPACIADPVTGKVSGTVTAVDPVTGVVTVDTGGGVLCTVNVNVTTTATHPIALLLGMYFGDLDSAALEEALTEAQPHLQGCAVTDGTTWTWADCGTVGAVQIRVTSVNPDGTYSAVVVVDGTPIASLVVTDPATQETLNGALETLLVYWTLDINGNRVPVSDQIAALHDQGIGFGVLVKLFAIAKASGGAVTVEELLAQVQSGVGMGELFKTYGKPPEVGVGHVRQNLKATNQGQPGNSTDGPGNGSGNGQSKNHQPPGQEKKNNQAPKDHENKGKGGCNGKGGKNCP